MTSSVSDIEITNQSQIKNTQQHSSTIENTTTESVSTDVVNFKLSSCYYSYWEPHFKSKDPGVWFWLLAPGIPVIFITILLGIIPLYNPRKNDIESFWTFTFVVAPIIMVVICYARTVTWLFCLQVDRPFHTHMWPLLVVYICTVIISSLIWAYNDIIPPRLFGVYIMVSAAGIVWLVLPLTEIRSIPVDERPTFWLAYKSYVIMDLVICVYLVCVILYVFAWRYSGETAQRFLPFSLVILTFIFRKILLSVTGKFSLEPAMLISGFVVENMEDMFGVLAFPLVTNPTTFFILWSVTATSNIANLLFLTKKWFLFRIWVKEFLKRVFTCGKHGNPCDVHEVPDFTNKPDDRGHSNNRPGYWRRQARFFLWKVISQLFSMVFYLLVVPVLRFGSNDHYYPLGVEAFPKRDYDYSVMYACGNTIFIILSGIIGLYVLSRHYPIVYNELRDVHSTLFVNHKYVGFVILTATHNGILSILLLLRHMNIWYAWDD